jgi:hypothetical protein
MEPDWKAIAARLEADRKYYAGVLASFFRHPIKPVAGKSSALQQAAMAKIVQRLEGAIGIVKERLRRAKRS